MPSVVCRLDKADRVSWTPLATREISDDVIEFPVTTDRVLRRHTALVTLVNDIG